jgi:hypothetical protein
MQKIAGILLVLVLAVVDRSDAQSGGRGQDSPPGAAAKVAVNDASQLIMRFQLIEASMQPGAPDPAIAPVDEVLRDLFRFTRYRLVSQAAMMLGLPPGGGASNSYQLLSGPTGDVYDLSVGLHARRTPDAGHTIAVALSQVDTLVAGPTSRDVALGDRSKRRVLLSTTVTVTAGRTLVLGSTQPGGSNTALILVVRPEIAKQ